MMVSKRMKTWQNGLGNNISNTLCFALFHLLTWLPIMQLSWCPISHGFTAFALSVLSSGHYLSLCHLKELHHPQHVHLTAKVGAGQWIKKKINVGDTLSHRDKDTNQMIIEEHGLWKKSLCGGNTLDLYRQRCPSCQTFFQKVDITDLRDEEHKAPFQMLPWYFFHLDIWVYLETSSRATLGV